VSRHHAARLVLLLTIAVTVAFGLGRIGRAAWIDGSTPAVATMCVLLALFAVAVVVWAASLPVDADARPRWRHIEAAQGEFVVSAESTRQHARLLRAIEITAEMGSVGPVWPTVDEDTCATEPILFTHEFRPSLAEFFEGTPGHHVGGVITAANDGSYTLTTTDGHEVRIGRHRAGTPAAELLRREGFNRERGSADA